MNEEPYNNFEEKAAIFDAIIDVRRQFVLKMNAEKQQHIKYLADRFGLTEAEVRRIWAIPIP